MKFKGVCIAGCDDRRKCLVSVELYVGPYPASNLTGRMCPRCGTLYVIDAYGEIVIDNIPGLRIKFPLYRNGILTGKVAFWNLDGLKKGRFLMSEESLGNYPRGPLGVKLPYFKKGILSGDVFEVGISLNNRTIGFVRPSRQV